jgi:hypothetical protein
MRARQGHWLAALVLALGLLAPAPARAEWLLYDLLHPYCDHGVYSPSHYWTPGIWYLREFCHPVNLDQYPPGPYPPVAPGYRITRYPCPYTPPAPSAAYADPAAYYERPPVSAEGPSRSNQPSETLPGPGGLEPGAGKER